MDDRRWPTYAPRNLVLDGPVDPGREGTCRVRSRDGRVFLDAIGGIGCGPLGHAHPRWVAAVRDGASGLVLAANTFWHEPQQALAARLSELFPVDDARVFLCNTGTEANEAALKLALRHTRRDVVIAFERAFHGRTLGSIGLTANPAYRDPYVQVLEEAHDDRFATMKVARARFNDLDDVARCFAAYPGRVAAVFVEPVQGEGGIYPASREFLVGLHQLCRAHGALLADDEIQCGTGRTGDWSAWQTIVGDDPQLRPDIVWLAKALGGGFPIGACIAPAAIAAAMGRGTHGSTFGGNPLACRVALATLAAIEDDDLLRRAARQVAVVRALAVEDPIPEVTEVRGLGAMIGIQIGAVEAQAAAPLGDALQREGLLATICGGHTVRWLFPYGVGDEVLREAWQALGRACARTLRAG
jgi:acetylornithine/succinyldiaminopimelate/putrescine aminotransferase